jgi:hypothetical protein
MRLAQGIHVLLMSLPLALSAAEVKKWVDAEGGVHFGDLPPRGSEFAVQTVDPVAVTPGRSELTLRPGEIEALERYEQRRKAHAPSNRAPAAQHRSDGAGGDRQAFYRKRCAYYRQRHEFFRDQKRHGYSRSEEAKIDERIAWSEMKVAEYCR